MERCVAVMVRQVHTLSLAQQLVRAPGRNLHLTTQGTQGNVRLVTSSAQRWIQVFFERGSQVKKGPFTAKGRKHMEVGKVLAGHCETITLHPG